jgi:S1-C subfamily serine protease
MQAIHHRSWQVAAAGLLAVALLAVAACSSSPAASHSGQSSPGSTSSQTSSVSTTGAPSGSSAATLEQSVISAIQKVQSAVVEIIATTSQGTVEGSGTIITPDGYILTNDHVVEGGQNFTVQTATTTYPAQVRGTDPADDLAVLKINASKALPTITFADSSKAQVGEFVIAVGNPLGLGESASFGIISALDRTVSEAPDGPANNIPNAIQTSAPINHGNSGGALIDLSGDMVGIPTLGATDPSANDSLAAGIGFAIPSDHAKFIADQLVQTGKVTNTGRAFLGVDLVDITPDIAAANNLPLSSGCYVQQLVSGGPAADAGIQVGDIIYKIDNTATPDSATLGSYLANKSPGQQVTVYVNRNGSNKQFNITLGTLPASS